MSMLHSMHVSIFIYKYDYQSKNKWTTNYKNPGVCDTIQDSERYDDMFVWNHWSIFGFIKRIKMGIQRRHV